MSKKQLRIFVITDAHEQWENLKLVTDWFQNENSGKKFDYVLICGDQSNCHNIVGEDINPEDNLKANQSNERYVNELEHFTDPGHLLIIPGNHDS